MGLFNRIQDKAADQAKKVMPDISTNVTDIARNWYIQGGDDYINHHPKRFDEHWDKMGQYIIDAIFSHKNPLTVRMAKQLARPMMEQLKDMIKGIYETGYDDMKNNTYDVDKRIKEMGGV